MSKSGIAGADWVAIVGMTVLRCLAGPLLLLAGDGCTQAPTPPANAPHPLVGRIYETATGRELQPSELQARLTTSQVIYLGEAHDEPAHHEAQLNVLRRVVGAGRRPALGFEIFAATQTGILRAYSQRTADADEWLRNAVGWSAPGDPNWGYYGALLHYAHAEKLELFGMDLDRTLRRRITKVGLDGLTALERRRLRSTGFHDPVYRDVMLEQLEASHCGYGDGAFLGRLYDTWLARNDSMAAAIVAAVNANPSRPVVAILGGGHTRYAMGVVERVVHLRPATRKLDVGLLSVTADDTEPGDYYADRPSAAPDYPPTHEIVWFTRSTPARLSDAERCARAFDRPVQR